MVKVTFDLVKPTFYSNLCVRGETLNKKVLYLESDMTLRVIIPLVFLMLVSNTLFGQKKKFSKSRTQPGWQILDEAKSVYEKNPERAIKLLEKIIKNKKKKPDIKLESEAYTLLGDIYKNIDQNELALNRYQKAFQVLEKSDYAYDQSNLAYLIGQIYLKINDPKQARTQFEICIDGDFKGLNQLCEEAMVEVNILEGNSEESISQIDELEEKYMMDSIASSRLDAKRSRAYSQQQDYDNANISLRNSVNSLPRNSKVDKSDYEEIEKAKVEILESNTLSTDEKINYSVNTITPKDRVEVLPNIEVRENLEVASLYEENNNLTEAEHFIELSKKAISNNTSAEYVAEVYKKSAEINEKKGAVNAALADLEKYVKAKEQAIDELQNELRQNVAIVKGQQKIDLTEKDVDIAAKDEELLQNQVTNQKWIIGLLSTLLAASLIFFYFLNKNVKAKRKANQLLLLKSLRTQMNPHFIFNALNSVNNFIAKNDEKAANKFLADFSKLMRKVLDHSQKDLISFEEEMELNELYLKLEHFRFRDKFDYSIEKNINLNTYDLEIPPMLIQPFIENAVWHGLRYKEAKGKLQVTLNETDKFLSIDIHDDGIGRIRSKELKTTNQKQYKSTGLANVSRRVALINEVYNKNYQIEVNDADKTASDVGTIVTIKIPI